MKLTENRISSIGLALTAALVLGCEDSPTTPTESGPAAPQSLVATATSDQRIDLSWVNAGDPASGYVVERRAGQAGGFDEITQLNSESRTSYADVDLSAEAEYCYRVSALGGGGSSDYSNVACGTTEAPGDRGDPPVLDATIPEVPKSTGPRPETRTFSGPSDSARTASVSKGALTPVAVGVFYLSKECGGINDFESCRMDYFRALEVYRDSLEVSGGTDTCNWEQQEKTNLDGSTYSWTYTLGCVTFHDFELEAVVRLKHDRIWRNVTSRALWPGTSYSITYRWTEGVETSNGFDWTSTEGTKTMSEDNWNNCVGGSVKAEAGVKLFGVETKVTGEVHDEGCWGGKEASETSESLSETFRNTETVTSQRGGEETTAVSGTDGSTRVYTVWQLVDQYTYVDSVGEEFTTDSVKAESGYSGIKSSFVDSPGWSQVDIIWPTPLHQNTQLFAQQTTDWPIESGSLVTPDQGQVRYFERTAGF